MKKLLSRTLSCALVLGMLGTVAMAAEQTVSSGTGSVTLSDVVSTETKTLTIDGEQKEVTIHYVADGSTYHMTLGPGVESYELGWYWYKDVADGYETLGGDMAMEEGTIDAESFFMDGGYVNLCALSASFSGGEVYFMLDGKQSGGAAPAPTTPADTTTPAPTETVPAAPADTATTTATTDGITYEVVKYDTLGHIALNNYGSYKYHTALYKANAEAFKATGGALKPGMVLTLPDTLGPAKRIGMPVAGDGETLYTVKAGDTLGGISKATYGDVMMYKAIFDRNSDRLTNANTIYEGQVIVLPAK